jgi:hypothetical protein
MSTITQPYVPTDGHTLDVDSYNRLIYDGGGGSNGIMSVANGGLDSANLNTNFKIQPEHIQPESMVIGRQESSRVRVDCFSDLFAKAGTDSTDPVTGDTMTYAEATGDYWVPVPGCALRFWQPYDATVAMWQWSMFFHPARMLMVRQYLDGAAAEPIGDRAANQSWYNIKAICDMGIAVKIDGSLIEHSRRRTQVGLVSRDNNSNLNVDYVGFMSRAYGGRTAQWWDMHHMSTPLASGWHDLQLVIYMERFLRTSATQTLTPVRNGVSMTDGSDPMSFVAQLFARCTFGVRNARVLTLL